MHDPDRPTPDTAPLTSDTPAPPSGPDRPGLRGVLAHRWPTLLALVLAAPGLADRPTPETVQALASALLLLPLWYLIISATGRRSWTWPVLVVGIGGFVLLRLQDRVEPAVVLLGLSLLAVLWGTVRGGLGRPSFLLQVAGFVAFGAVALTGLVLAPEAARYAIAAGWFGHGLWDLAHMRANAGVSRTGAEWCGVVDVLVGVQLAVVPLVL